MNIPLIKNLTETENVSFFQQDWLDRRENNKFPTDRTRTVFLF